MIVAKKDAKSSKSIKLMGMHETAKCSFASFLTLAAIPWPIASVLVHIAYNKQHTMDTFCYVLF